MSTNKFNLDPFYLDNRAKSLWTWSQKGHLCDVTLKVGSVTLTAHRVVLAQVSPYFEGKFSGRFDANDKVMTYVDLSKDVERVSDLELILEAVYTGELTLDEDSINGVFHLASFFMIDCIRKICQIYMEEHLTLSTCLNFYLLAETYSLPSFFTVTTTILQSRFHDFFIRGEELLQVSGEGLQRIFQNNLHLHCLPCQVVDFLIRWTEAMMGDSSGDGKSLELLSEMIRTESEERLRGMLAHLSAQAGGIGDLRKSFEEVIKEELDCRQEAPDNHGTQILANPVEHSDQSSASIQSQTLRTNETPAVNPNSCSEEPYSGCSESDHAAKDRATPKEQEEGKTAAGNSEDSPLCGTDQHSVRNSGDCQDPSASGSSAVSKLARRTWESSSTGSDAVMASSSGVSGAGETVTKRRCLSSPGAKDPESALEVLVVVAPSKVPMQSSSRNQKYRLPLEIVMYSPLHRKWNYVGSVKCPMFMDEKNSWRMTSVKEDIYFISPFEEVGYRLSLPSLQWTEFFMEPVFEGLEEVYTVSPMSVNGHLHVLASNRLFGPDDKYLTEHKYFRLEVDSSWTEVGQVSHLHSDQPLSIINVSGSKVYVLKADIPPLVFRDHNILQEGHILDTTTGAIEMFTGTCFVYTPSRMLVQSGEIYVVDGDKSMLRFDRKLQKWSSPETVNLGDLQWCRTHAAESHFPWQGHASAAAGHSFFEVHGFMDNTSSLLEVMVDKEGKLNSITHVPPPCSYFTLISSGSVDPAFFASLEQCGYLHA